MSTVGAPGSFEAVGEAIEADRWVEGPGLLTLLARRVRTNRPLLVGLAMLGGFLLAGVIAFVLYFGRFDVIPVDYAIANMLPPPGPGLAHPFGYMGINGYDIAQAEFQATPIDLALLGGPILMALSSGALLGAYAGLKGGAWDAVVTTAADIVVGVPSFFLIIVLFLGVEYFVPIDDRVLLFGLLFAVVLWPYYARSVRAQARHVSGAWYVEAARVSGAGSGRLLSRHVLPNSFAPALAQVPVDLFSILFVLTLFPFITCYTSVNGGGLFALLSPLPNPYHYPEWGALLATGACSGWSPLASANFWWMYTFPAAVIVLFGIAVGLTCDGVQRLLQPRTRLA